MSIVKAKIKPFNGRWVGILSWRSKGLKDNNYNERIMFETRSQAISKLKHWYHVKENLIEVEGEYEKEQMLN